MLLLHNEYLNSWLTMLLCFCSCPCRWPPAQHGCHCGGCSMLYLHNEYLDS
jgi:hypothetical protein